VASLAAVKEPSLAAPLALAADTYTNTTKINIIAKHCRGEAFESGRLQGLPDSLSPISNSLLICC
jgi:hypothetical protein